MDNYEDLVYNFLLSEFEGNKFAVCGIMGNLKAESNLNPINLQNSYEKTLGMTDEEYTEAVRKGAYTREQFVNDHAGYGFCQWTYWSRKQGLYDYCYKKTGESYYVFNLQIGDPILQLEYMMIELKQNKSLYNKLLTCEDIADAAEWFCLEFEKPAGGEKSVPKRIDYALDYWNKLANNDTNSDLGPIKESYQEIAPGKYVTITEYALMNIFEQLKTINYNFSKIYILLGGKDDGRTK